ncbi:hypothetical protein CFOL_v3_08518 [Cephalotus follicularis]|uniref:PTM/DIR17-like Tudor domain-containing protein n=1 Tax=Cephalotus follicularis TaxID=3775 RepID=A0A1Q3BB52_CEPFO|nr:hypothetical protein CFOL_v3_08518 [Cephalotus follicularis]
MGNLITEQESESLTTGVFELKGEPAIVINGVPDISPSSDTVVLTNTTSDADSLRRTGCGEWLEGREVRKLFGEQYYSGTVIQFDKETGWYRVVYEDGDFEDLNWHELEDVLLPLDISIPLKTLAQKIIRKSQKPIFGSGTFRKRKASNLGSKPEVTEAHEETTPTKS